MAGYPKLVEGRSAPAAPPPETKDEWGFVDDQFLRNEAAHLHNLRVRWGSRWKEGMPENAWHKALATQGGYICTGCDEWVPRSEVGR